MKNFKALLWATLFLSENAFCEDRINLVRQWQIAKSNNQIEKMFVEIKKDANGDYYADLLMGDKKSCLDCGLEAYKNKHLFEKLKPTADDQYFDHGLFYNIKIKKYEPFSLKINRNGRTLSIHGTDTQPPSALHEIWTIHQPSQ